MTGFCGSAYGRKFLCQWFLLLLPVCFSWLQASKPYCFEDFISDLRDLGVELQRNFKSYESSLSTSYRQAQDRVGSVGLSYVQCKVFHSFTSMTGQLRVSLLKAHAEQSGHQLIILVLPLVDLI